LGQVKPKKPTTNKAFLCTLLAAAAELVAAGDSIESLNIAATQD